MTLKLNTVHEGDCLDLMAEIDDCSVDMVMADPPYGTTACKWDSIIPLDDMWAHLKRVVKPNGAIVMTASQPFTTKLISSNMEWFKYCWVWEKPQGVDPFQASNRPLNNYEDVTVFYNSKPYFNPQKTKGSPYFIVRDKTPRTHEVTNTIMKKTVTANNGDRCPTRILKFNQETGVHPTQKPVALMAYLIKTYTNEGDTVMDFCCGSGTTGVACKRWNRNFILIEKEPEYCEIARHRLDAEDNLFSEEVAV